MPKTEKSDELAFEEAMQRLESIVDAMEQGDLPLETLMARFEEGTRLAKICQAKLSDAEVKIRQVETNAAGELSARPFEVADDNE